MNTTNLQNRRLSRPAAGCTLLGLLLLLVLSSAHSAWAQNGYIYVHKSALNEESSVDFPFTVTGGPTTVSGFSLNDQPDRLVTIDVGAGDSGLWALSGAGVVAGSGFIYYRPNSSSAWTQVSPGSEALRIDGGPGTTNVIVGSDRRVYYYNGSGYSSTGNPAGSAVDVAFDRANNQLYYVDTMGIIYTKPATSGSWTAVSGINAATGGLGRIDVGPTGTLVYIGTNGLTVFTRSSTGTNTNLGRPADRLIDVTIADDGTIYASAITSLTDGVVFRFSGGSWVQEPTSRATKSITGGPAGELWGTNLGQILTRTGSGSAVGVWLDDERVRTSPVNGNSQLIAVAPGTYTVTEGAVANWNLQNITLYDPTNNSTTSLTGSTATLNVASGEVVHVVFQNGLTQSTAVVNTCGTTFTEDFGTGQAGVNQGPVLTGLTDYHSQISKGTPLGTELLDGYYAVVSQSNDVGYGPAIGTGPNSFDHTTANGTGRFLFINANYQANTFYRRRFTGLLTGVQYTLSYWVLNVTGNNGTTAGVQTAIIPPNVKASIVDPTTGTVLGTANSGDINTVGVWFNRTLTFTASQPDIDLFLSNNTIGGSGNDLAIDDITFGLAVPVEPVVTVTQAGCTSPTASLTVTAPMGASLEYSINGTTYQSSPVFSGLAVPATYSVTARYIGSNGCASPPTAVTFNSAICGNVLNDANGLTDNTVNGPGVNGPSVSGTPLYASLVSNGVVIATVPITSTGSYSFTNVTGGTYNVVLTTNSAGSTTPSLPASWTSTGENLGTAAGNDGTVNGTLAVTVTMGTVTEANFGIEQVPTAGSGTNTVANGGGTTPVPVPANTFTNTTPSSDVAPGNVTSILITGFPTNTTSLTINGTVYTPGNFPAGGVTVPTDGSGNPTVPILVDPINDANPVSIPFRAIDNAGVLSPNTGTAVLNFQPQINLSGNVLNDANGLTDNTVNGPGVDGTNVSGTPVYVSLVQNGVVIATVPVSPTGSYSFTNVTAGNYTVVLTTNPAGSTTPSVPASWTSTGENLGTAAGSDGTVNGSLPVTVSATSVTDANLAIERVPVVTTGTNPTQVNPGGTIAAPVSSTLFTGTDPEDGTYPNNLTGRTVTLTPATNGTLYYNGNPVTATTVIPNFDPTKLTLDPTATGATTGTGGAAPDPTFTYTVRDNAGVESLPATITVPFTAALPVSLVSFTASVQADQRVLLAWVTAWERSNKGYTLERSKDLLSFEVVGQVSDVAGTSNELTTYRFVDASPYSGTSYYRLSQVDLDGTRKVFPAISVVVRSEAYGVFPNPVKDSQFTLNLDEPLTASVNLYTADGRAVSLQKGTSTASSLHLKATQPLPTGVYVLRVQERGQLRQYRIVIQ